MPWFKKITEWGAGEWGELESNCASKIYDYDLILFESVRGNLALSQPF